MGDLMRAYSVLYSGYTQGDLMRAYVPMTHVMQAPITLEGKAVTVIWMFFGILAFGVFCR